MLRLQRFVNNKQISVVFCIYKSVFWDAIYDILLSWRDKNGTNFILDSEKKANRKARL